MRLSGTIAALSTLSLIGLALAGCSAGGSSSGSGSGSSSGSGGGSSPSSGGAAATATFTGDLTGTIAMNLCTDSGVDSIFVFVKGDTTKYLGSVSADDLGFVGPDAKDWSIDKGAGVAPVALSGGSGGYTVDGVKVHYNLPGSPVQEITVTGKLVCP